MIHSPRAVMTEATTTAYSAVVKAPDLNEGDAAPVVPVCVAPVSTGVDVGITFVFLTTVGIAVGATFCHFVDVGVYIAASSKGSEAVVVWIADPLVEVREAVSNRAVKVRRATVVIDCEVLEPERLLYGISREFETVSWAKLLPCEHSRPMNCREPGACAACE